MPLNLPLQWVCLLVYSNGMHKVPLPKFKIQRIPPVALSPVYMNLWKKRQTIPEMQPRGVTGPSCVEVASLAIGNWKFMVVKGRFSGKGSLSLIRRTRKEILKGQGIFLEGVMACAEA